MAAVGANAADLAQLLLDHGASPSLRAHDGKTAWDMALENYAIGVLRVLGGPPGEAQPNK